MLTKTLLIGIYYLSKFVIQTNLTKSKKCFCYFKNLLSSNNLRINSLVGLIALIYLFQEYNLVDIFLQIIKVKIFIKVFLLVLNQNFNIT